MQDRRIQGICHVNQYDDEPTIPLEWRKKICGLACLKMCIGHMKGVSPSLKQLLKFKDLEIRGLSFNDGEEKAIRCYIPRIGWPHYGLVTIAKRFGVSGCVDRIPPDRLVETIRSHLENKLYIIASVDKFLFPYRKKRKGHLVVISGIKECPSGVKIILNDPLDHASKSVSIDRFLKAFLGFIIVLGEEDREWFRSCNPISMETVHGKRSDRLYVHLHENETPSKEIAIRFAKSGGGTVLALTQNGERFLRYVIDDREGGKICLRIDPNRIFTEAGLRKTLKERNSHLQEEYMETAMKKARMIRDYILRKIELAGKSRCIAIHNNRLLDISQYDNGSGLVKKTDSMPGNAFVLCTDPEDFRALGQKSVNCAIEEMKDAEGTLSNHFILSGKRMLTIESGYEDVESFQRLLNITGNL